MNNLLIALCGPSGSGKGYLKQYLKKGFGAHEPPVFTTRRKREKEDSLDRIFLAPKEFERKLGRGELILVKKIYGNNYGFSADAFEKSSIVTEIHASNLNDFKMRYPHSLTIALLPKKLSFLKTRLRKRGSNTQEEICLRLEKAEQEIEEILTNKSCLDYIYWIDETTEKNICKDIKSFIESPHAKN